MAYQAKGRFEMPPVNPAMKMTRARTALLLDNERPSAAFLATCAMHLQMKMDAGIEAVRTNGTTLFYNPDFVESLQDVHLQAIIAHEVLHAALCHPYRRGQRDAQRYNVACDHVVNHQLKEWGFQLPSDCIYDSQYSGMSVEAVYAKMMKEQEQQPEPEKEEEEQQDEQQEEEQQQSGGSAGEDGYGQGESDTEQQSTDSPTEANGQSNDDPMNPSSLVPGCSTGDFVDADTTPQTQDQDGSPVPPPMTAEDWGIVAEQAALAATAAGQLGGGMDLQLRAARSPRTDWRQELRQYITQLVESQQSWMKPNRRMIGTSTYLPGAIRDTVGEIVVAIDTSGSVYQSMLDSFAAHINVIATEVQPERIHVVYCDTEIRGSETFEHGEEVTLTLKGGGGTLFQPVFDWIAEQDIEPLVCIYLTDLECWTQPQPTTYPTLWATPLWVNKEAPFGDVLRIDVEE